jgi:hypothetical protein
MSEIIQSFVISDYNSSTSKQAVMKASEIYIIHKDWKGHCVLDPTKNTIYRKELSEEIGTYKIVENKLSIHWEKWDTENYFSNYNLSSFFLESLYYETYQDIYILDRELKYLIILNIKTQQFVVWNKDKLYGKYVYTPNGVHIIFYFHNHIIKKYKKMTQNSYFYDSVECIYFNIELSINNKIEKFICNKLTKNFYNIYYHSTDYGIYNIQDNILTMIWSNGEKKKFCNNLFYSLHDQNKNELHIIKPNSIFIGTRVLFSNISLCKNKIICTSIYYKENPWNINDIYIKTENALILNKHIYENDDYESSLSIILELDKEVNHLILNVKYLNLVDTSIYLEDLKLETSEIAAMTLFKDDYSLLKKYISYYSNLGISLFFLYYNGSLLQTLDSSINNEIIDFIKTLINSEIKIYLIEWNFEYWYKCESFFLKKHHHAQTMAINDSLHILKNYVQYILYNDLDEYFSDCENFSKLIKENLDNDIFVFKNRFCKMGINLVKYNDFNKEFDLNKIILGNYWDSGREKNLIKVDKINAMGVHKCFPKFSEKNIVLKEKVIGEFYHIINFEEKNREILMTSYNIDN